MPSSSCTHCRDMDQFKDVIGALSSNQLEMQNLILPAPCQALLEVTSTPREFF